MLSSSSLIFASTSLLQTFDSADTFTNNFTQSSPSSGTFTWNATSGLNGGPGISISSGSDQVWTTKESYSVAANGIYSASAFMYSANSGYGAVGFSIQTQDSNTGLYGAPGGSHFGAFFHGGGGGFLNNGPIKPDGSAATNNQPITWSNAVQDGQWYKLVFTATAKGGNKFDLKLQIFNSSNAGVLGSLVTEHTMTDDMSVASRVGPAITNTQIGTASAVRTFFSADGSRISKIDNFGIDLGGGATYIAPPVPAPTVTSVNPSTGLTAGGTAITITGTDLTGATAITVGGAACSTFNVVSATSATCTTPAGATGAASVLVTTPSGTNAANTLFTYATPPAVTSVSPNTGPTEGGTVFTITGTDLTGATSITVGGVACTNFNVTSATSATCTSPTRTAGTASVLVTTAGGTNAANTLFTYFVAPIPTLSEWAMIFMASLMAMFGIRRMRRNK